MSSWDSESSEDDSGSDDSQQPRIRQRKVGPELWHDVRMQNVRELPEGINGLVSFRIENVPKKDLLNALKDGRRWKKNCPSNWAGHKRATAAVTGL